MTLRNYVLGFCLTPHGTVLIEKAKPEWQRGKWNGIGGSIEDGETPVDAMVREFEEEAGTHSHQEDWTELLTLSGDTLGDTAKPWQMTVFMAYMDLFPSSFPYETDEGIADIQCGFPDPMDSTAWWLLWMCIDLQKHGIRIGASAGLVGTLTPSAHGRGCAGEGERIVIEINRGKSLWVYRINPFNPRLIDRRKNKHFARWSPYQTCDTADEAVVELLKLERPTGNKVE